MEFGFTKNNYLQFMCIRGKFALYVIASWDSGAPSELIIICFFSWCVAPCWNQIALQAIIWTHKIGFICRIRGICISGYSFDLRLSQKVEMIKPQSSALGLNEIF